MAWFRNQLGRQTLTNSLRRKTSLLRLSMFLGCFATVVFWTLHVLARQTLAAKYTGTRFDGVEAMTVLAVGQGEEVILTVRNPGVTLKARNELLAARDEWRLLGKGWEGTAWKWNGSVVKVFDGRHSPLRNCLPLDSSSHRSRVDADNEAMRWPSDIPASLLLNERPGFVPITDAFLAMTGQRDLPQWYMITRLMPGGTLKDLAERVRDLTTSKDIGALDQQFRSHFTELLSALQFLHDTGFCHDDIKPGNIFIDVASEQHSEDGNWVIGDLGNVREIGHPYHSSRLWVNDNGQLHDCRANDALRVVKTYVQFLRHASTNSGTDDFDTRLFAAEEEWSRLLWYALDAGTELRANDVLRWSTTTMPSHSPSRARLHRGAYEYLQGPSRLWRGGSETLDKAAEALLKTAVSERWQRVLGLTWILGVPLGEC
jgi:hypothetical protein